MSSSDRNASHPSPWPRFLLLFILFAFAIPPLAWAKPLVATKAPGDHDPDGLPEDWPAFTSQCVAPLEVDSPTFTLLVLHAAYGVSGSPHTRFSVMHDEEHVRKEPRHSLETTCLLRMT